jgi:purine-binding chemotaxis protein CheW
MEDEKQLAEAYIAFELAGTTYAVPSSVVQQIEMVEQITPVPNAPAAVEGVVYSRGQVIPAVSLRSRFGFEKIPTGLRTRLIVVNISDRTVGLIVDTAREFITIAHDAIQPPNEAISGTSGRYLKGIATLGDRMILILDLEGVINLSEIMMSNQPAALTSQGSVGL